MEKSKIRLLIVEDSEDDAYLVERVLRQHGFDLETRRVQTDEDMRRALAEERWDLIISDYLMPEFNAMGAIQRYRDAGADIPFLVVSGSIGEEVAVEAMRSGVHDYMMKDNLARLPLTVERELREARNRRERRAMAEGLSNELKQSILEIHRNTSEALQLAQEDPLLRDRLHQALQATEHALATIQNLSVRQVERSASISAATASPINPEE